MIDLHKHLRKYEILQTPFRPRFGYKYEQELLKTKQNDLYILKKLLGKMKINILSSGEIIQISLIVGLIKIIL